MRATHRQIDEFLFGCLKLECAASGRKPKVCHFLPKSLHFHYTRGSGRTLARHFVGSKFRDHRKHWPDGYGVGALCSSAGRDIPLETFALGTCLSCAVYLAQALFLSHAWLAGVCARRDPDVVPIPPGFPAEK